MSFNVQKAEYQGFPMRYITFLQHNYFRKYLAKSVELLFTGRILFCGSVLTRLGKQGSLLRSDLGLCSLYCFQIPSLHCCEINLLFIMQPYICICINKNQLCTYMDRYQGFWNVVRFQKLKTQMSNMTSLVGQNSSFLINMSIGCKQSCQRFSFFKFSSQILWPFLAPNIDILFFFNVLLLKLWYSG